MRNNPTSLHRLLLLALALAACSDDSLPITPPDPTAALYDPKRVLEVALTLPPADWDALRRQARDPVDILGPGCHDAPAASPYTWFHADATVDGTRVADIGVRKKGFLGSASVSKPSLKLSFDRFHAGQMVSGADELTLNNARQDPSLVRTCLALLLFARAGVPASRCSFAHVTVNGADLGVYVNIEPIEKSMLARHFADPTGDLYEGQLSDVRDGWLATFDKKQGDGAALAALKDTLAAGGTDLASRVSLQVDLDTFHRYWAMEALAASWDGYTNNANNYFMYRDPRDGRFHYLPWGPDATFGDDDGLRNEPGRPSAVAARTELPFRLYQSTEGKKRYLDTLKQLLGGPWDEAWALAEIDRMQALLAPYAKPADFAAAVEKVRGFVKTRRAVVEAEIAAGPPPWNLGQPPAQCMRKLGRVTSAFTTSWGTLGAPNPFLTGKGTLDLTWPAPLTAQMTGAAAGMEQGAGRATLQIFGLFPNNNIFVVVLQVDPSEYAIRPDLPLDWQSAFGLLVFAEGGKMPRPVGLLTAGKLHFDKAGATPGAPVSGTLEADIYGG